MTGAARAGDPPRPGEVFDSGSIQVTEALRAETVRLGGYTHPVFTRPDEVRLPGGSPLPGQAVLLLMGGLAEQTGRFGDTIALLEITDVRFARPVTAGTTMRVRISVLEETPRSGSKAVRTMRWEALDGENTVLVSSVVRMLIAGLGISESGR